MSDIAWGVELEGSSELGSLVSARARAGGGWLVAVEFYQPALMLTAAVEAAVEAAGADVLGVFCDPMPCAAVLDDLRERVWVSTLEAVDVAAATSQFLMAVRARQVTAAEHPALEQAITYAVRRPLAAAFGFERHKVPCDMSPLNAAAFALWGLRKNEAVSQPGAMTF